MYPESVDQNIHFKYRFIETFVFFSKKRRHEDHGNCSNTPPPVTHGTRGLDDLSQGSRGSSGYKEFYQFFGTGPPDDVWDGRLYKQSRDLFRDTRTT